MDLTVRHRLVVAEEPRPRKAPRRAPPRVVWSPPLPWREVAALPEELLELERSYPRPAPLLDEPTLVTNWSQVLTMTPDEHESKRPN